MIEFDKLNILIIDILLIGKFTDMVYPFLKNILLKIKSKSRGKKQKKER